MIRLALLQLRRQGIFFVALALTIGSALTLLLASLWLSTAWQSQDGDGRLFLLRRWSQIEQRQVSLPTFQPQDLAQVPAVAAHARLIRSEFTRGIATIAGQQVVLHAAMVDSTVFTLLQLTPSSGRLFDRTDDLPTAEIGVVISPRLWRERFHSAPITNQTIDFNWRRYRILGVVSTQPSIASDTDLFLNNVARLSDVLNNSGILSANPVALVHLRSGVPIHQAEYQLRTFFTTRQSGKTHDYIYQLLRPSALERESWSSANPSLAMVTSGLFLQLLLFTIALWLIYLARHAAADQLRLWLGEPLWMSIATTATESMAVSLAGLALALAALLWAGPLLDPRLRTTAMPWHWAVIAFAATILILITLGAFARLRWSASTLRRVQTALVWIIVGTSALGATLGAIFGLHVWRASFNQPGLPAPLSSVAQVQLNGSDLKQQTLLATRLHRLDAALAAHPSIRTHAILNFFPLLDNYFRVGLWPDRNTNSDILNESHAVELREVAGNYAVLLHLEVLAGDPTRLLTEPNTIVLDESALPLAGLTATNALNSIARIYTNPYRVVAVVRSSTYRGANLNHLPAIYRPFRFDDAILPFLTIVVDTHYDQDARDVLSPLIGDSLGTAGALRLDRAGSILELALSSERRGSRHLLIATIFGLTLSCFLTWIATERWLASRRQEIAIRLALGASPRAIVRLVCHSAWLGLLCSATLGACLAIVVARPLRHLIYLALPDAWAAALAIALFLQLTVLSVMAFATLRNSSLSIYAILSSTSRSLRH